MGRAPPVTLANCAMDISDEALGDDIEWPVIGTVMSVDRNRRKLTLSRTSQHYHVGMFLVLDEYKPGAAVDEEEEPPCLCVASIDGNVVELEEALPQGVHANGRPFYTLPRVTPDDVNEYQAIDCINVLEAMHDELRSDECVASREARLSTLNVQDDDGSPAAIAKAWAMCQRTMNVLKEKCRAFGVIDSERPLSVRCTKLLNNVLTLLNRVFESEYAERAYRSAASGTAASTKYVSLWNFSLTAEGKKHDYTELVEYFLRLALRSNLRHRDDIVYEQVMTVVDKWRPLADNPKCTHREPHTDVQCDNFACFARDDMEDRQRCEAHRLDTDVDCRLLAEDDSKPALRRIREEERQSFVVPTRAWRPMMHGGQPMTIRKWMHMNVDQHTQPHLWNKFFQFYGQGTATCCNYMATSDNPSFPQYSPNRRMFSFQNGVYDILKNRFYRYMYDTVPDVCCVNHVDAHFDESWIRVPLDVLRVPGYDDILASQSYDDEMCLWLAVFLGRLLHPVGELDHWEKFLVIKGWAATGKSTIAKAFIVLLGASNVGNIPANCEEQWALASVYDKLLWMCTELKRDWKFPVAVLQSMISGEVVPVHIKNKTAVDVSWRIQGLVVGNEEPTAWVNDPMNAMYRRTLPFPFDKTPKTQDPTIQKRFMNNLGRFLVKISRAYMYAVTEFVRDGNLDNVLAPRLKEARETFLKNTQPLVRFLQESADVILAPSDIRDLFKADASRAAGARGGNGAAAPAGPLGTVGTLATTEDAAAVRRTWRIRLTELNTKFKDWWIQNNVGPKPIPSVLSKNVYDIAIKHCGVIVERDDAERADYMYGVRPSSTAVNNGYQPVMFSSGPGTLPGLV